MHHVHQAAGMPHIICNALLACLLGCSAPAFYMQQLCHVSIAGFLHVQACGRSGVCCVECICCSGFLLPKVMPLAERTTGNITAKCIEASGHRHLWHRSPRLCLDDLIHAFASLDDLIHAFASSGAQLCYLWQSTADRLVAHCTAAGVEACCHVSQLCTCSCCSSTYDWALITALSH